jgi:uncharacterized membrane protein
MTDPQPGKFICPVCHEEKDALLAKPVELLHGDVAQALERIAPGQAPATLICDACLDDLHGAYYEDALSADVGELDLLEREVVHSLSRQKLLAGNVNDEFDEQLSVGDRIADRVAAVGGSWAFIISFVALLIIWIGLNVLLATRAFDPYPFILLNLVLSTVAAIQAPVIMMSQNRHSEKDRRGAEQDNQTNLRAGLHPRHIHHMLDYMMRKQWQRMLEIQRVQESQIEALARLTPHLADGREAADVDAALLPALPSSQ